MDDNMRVIGKMIFVMERALNVILMVIHILDISKWAKHMAKGSIRGATGKYMMVSGIKV